MNEQQQGQLRDMMHRYGTRRVVRAIECCIKRAAPAKRHLEPVTFDDMTRAAATWCGVTQRDVVGHCRRKPITQARAIVARVMHEHQQISYPNIAAAFGRTGHSTFISAARRAGEHDANAVLILARFYAVRRREAS